MTYCRTNLLPVNETLQSALSSKVARIQQNLDLVADAMQRAESASFEASRHAYLMIAQQVFDGVRLAPLPTLADFGYRQGVYTCSCSKCRRSYVGDRESSVCNICAEKDLARSIVPGVVFPNE